MLQFEDGVAWKGVGGLSFALGDGTALAVKWTNLKKKLVALSLPTQAAAATTLVISGFTLPYLNSKALYGLTPRVKMSFHKDCLRLAEGTVSLPNYSTFSTPAGLLSVNTACSNRVTNIGSFVSGNDEAVVSLCIGLTMDLTAIQNRGITRLLV